MEKNELTAEQYQIEMLKQRNFLSDHFSETMMIALFVAFAAFIVWQSYFAGFYAAKLQKSVEFTKYFCNYFIVNQIFMLILRIN
jgi:uncharacterized membrane protein (DUF485 family)